jgi:HK97 family phage prohead protease
MRATVAAPRRRERRQVAVTPRRLVGWFALHGVEAEICNPAEGHFVESVRYGAFSDAVASAKDGVSPPFMLSHTKHPVVGQTPVAKVTTLTHSVRGGWVEAAPLSSRMVREHLVEPTRAGLMSMSIGFTVPPQGEVWRPPATRAGLPRRELVSVKLREISATATPAYAGTNLSYRDAQNSQVPTLDDDVHGDVHDTVRSRTLFLINADLK